MDRKLHSYEIDELVELLNYLLQLVPKYADQAERAQSMLDLLQEGSDGEA